MKSSFFGDITEAPADAIFQQALAFKSDPRKGKINLGIGLYRDEAGQTPILKTVKAAEKLLLSEEETKEYLPIVGDSLYLEESGKLIFGDALWAENQKRICGVQAPGGTGGLRIGAEFLKISVGNTIAIPDPTWPNHAAIFKQCGYEIQSYAYYDAAEQRLRMESIVEMLQRAPAKSTVLFHACCHNPTGADPTEKEWEEIAHLLKTKNLLPFFDFAYQGFGRGLDEDAEVLRLFTQKKIECAIAFSHSKNFGLYSERVGGIFVASVDQDIAKNILSRLKICARTNYSNPPRHGAAIVAKILSTPELKALWIKEVGGMRERIEQLRKEFVSTLQSGQTVIDFSHLFSRVGMFCFLGLSGAQVLRLKEEDGIYMASGGRINLAGLSWSTLGRVAESICKVIQ